MSDRTLVLSRRTLLQMSAIFGAGTAFGGIVLKGDSVGGRSALAALDATPDATATRKAELDELNALRTQVAQPPTCVAPATATPVPPTPTATQVPLSQAGVPLTLEDIWTVTVLGIAPAMPPATMPPAGKYMQVNMTVSHSAPTPKFFPITDFLLTDSAGRFSIVDIAINQAIFGTMWALATEPGVTENRSVVFDVAAGAGDTFVLEEPRDPTFRVGLTVEQRG